MKPLKSEISLSIGEVAELIGVTPGMLRTWEREELFSADRTKGGHRIFRDSHLKRLRKIAQLYIEEKLNPAAIRKELGAPELGVQVAENFVDAQLGERLRMLRRQRKLTLVEAAERSRLSPSFISALERGNTGVSLEALFRLAEVLGTTIPSLRGEDLPPAKRRFVPAAHRPRFVTDDKTLVIEDLITKPAGMEAEIAHLEPGGDSNGVWSHKGQEFLYVLSGTLSFWLEPEEFYSLKAGDALYLHSDLKHRWKNEGKTTASILWVNAWLPKSAVVRSETRQNKTRKSAKRI
jgi:DNA-binding transcriptional MerR regulator/quercetin dioxygenase-like cupin family protein